MASSLLVSWAMSAARPPRARRRERAAAIVVAANPETLDGLEGYLRGAGVVARCTRDLDDCARLASEAGGRVAVVLFPDDFRRDRVVTALDELGRTRTLAKAVLVTSHPRELEKLPSAEGVVILPRPAWGWTILDAIRAAIDGGIA